ncbi:MAG: tautomerase family protein [Synergistaceae bacterium]|nr:tautomerase family protein [Synergistaceae bacterium]
MPMIQVNLIAGHSMEEKRKFAANVTRIACEDLNVQPEQVWVQIIDMPTDSFAVAGTLIADRATAFTFDSNKAGLPN